MPDPAHLFVTGAYRSGTTLAEKLAHMLPDASVASQPFPFLYVEAKRRFLAARGHRDAYPLGHLFRETRYAAADLARFLDEHRFGPAEVRALLEDMRDYSGWWTPEIAAHADDLGGGTFPQIHERVHAAAARALGRPGAAVVGSKEILCEEYLPYLLARDERVLLVLRDPRAMLASLVSGEGERFGGRRRPVLFHLRTWRKGVAAALAFDGHERMLAVRYEDVVADPSAFLARLASWLDLPAPARDALDAGVLDQRGVAWTGNSSFGARDGVSDASVARWRGALDEPTLRYVDACCGPEMRALGYQPHAPGGGSRDAIEGYAEPFPVDHPAFAGDDSHAPDRAAAEEIERLRLVGEDLDERAAAEWFVYPAAHRRLRAQRAPA